MQRSKDRAPKIFLGPLEISGYYANLERGFAAGSVSARLVTLHPHPLNFEQPQPNPWPARLSCAVVLIHRRVPAPIRILTGAVYLFACLATLLWSIPRFNTYIFSWGVSLLPGNLDISLLRLLRKRVVVVVGHGSEARPPYMSTPEGWTGTPDELAIRTLRNRTVRLARSIARIERWASDVIGLATTGQFLRREFVDFYALGIPTPLPASAPATPPGDPLARSKFVVLHVPSKPEVKGTAEIRRCMTSIVAAHPHVRYVELSGRPHAEILDALANCDLVVDQLWSDIPMAVVGAEAAALSKPTVIAGYAWKFYSDMLHHAAWPPTVMCAPDQLEATIAACVQDPQAMVALGQRSRDFLANNWNPASVAERYLRVLSKTVPAEWIIDPGQITYGLGCGVSEENVRLMTNGLISSYGIASLRWPAAARVYEPESH